MPPSEGDVVLSRNVMGVNCASHVELVDVPEATYVGKDAVFLGALLLRNP